MARINIEDDFWVEIGGVSAALGDEDKAIGMVVRFFRLAQSKFKQNKAITEDEFLAKGFHESLIGRFAKRTDCGIMAIGSEKHFSWISSRKEAGKSGGKQTQAKRSKPKQVQPSSSSSLSSSSSVSKNNNTPPDGFVDFYSKYPRREKKKEARRRYDTLIKSGVGHEEIMRGLANYVSYLTAQKTDPKFYKLPTTWLNELPDNWINEDAKMTLALIKQGSWMEKSADLWAWVSGANQNIDPALLALAECIGIERLRGMHRDEFRPNGVIPGLLKLASEGRVV